MENALISWAKENKERLKFALLEVALIDEKGVEFKWQGGHTFQLSMPASVFTANDDDDDDDDDEDEDEDEDGDEFEMFFAYSLGKQEESSKEFKNKLKLLNEKIQTVEIGLGRRALELLMNHIIDTFAGEQRERQGAIKAPEESGSKNLDKKVDRVFHSGGANSGLSRAIMTEFNKLAYPGFSRSASAGDFMHGISVEIPDESNICKWHVKMDTSLFKGSEGLYQDLQNYASRVNKSSGRETEKEKGEENFSGVLLEMSFPDEYPFSPPFVRVLCPKFRFHTGHVTLGGAICTEMLTPSGWRPSFSMETVLVQIQNAIVEGGGRLEMEASLSDAHRDYTVDAARSAFDRFARQHGWMN